MAKPFGSGGRRTLVVHADTTERRQRTALHAPSTRAKEARVVWAGVSEIIEVDHSPWERHSAIRTAEAQQGGRAKDEAERGNELGEAAAEPAKHLLATVTRRVRFTIGINGLVAVIVHVAHVAAEAKVGRVRLVAAFEGEGYHGTAVL